MLHKFGNRISMLHVKDFMLPDTSSAAARIARRVAELGQGTIDYNPILHEAAKAGNIKHCFVEQEAFNVPLEESLKIDADYMRKLGMGETHPRPAPAFCLPTTREQHPEW